MDNWPQAILALLPSLARLEAGLRSMETEALARQQRMAEALDRIASALETLPGSHAGLMSVLSEWQRNAASMTASMQSLERRLAQEEKKRAELTKVMAEVVALLRAPA
jgi:septal ring factor EnvC (AmiA/AmiB activator)